MTEKVDTEKDTRQKNIEKKNRPEEKNTVCTAIVLAAGQGKRMGSRIQKQYLELEGRPVLYYSLRCFEMSDIIDHIILVAGEGQEEYCREEIVEKYGFRKVRQVVAGGAERYHSVWNGLQAVQENGFGEGYIFIHDGARPFISQEILNRVYEKVKVEDACVVGMPVKDTIKIVDEEQFAKETPNRKYVWMVQTPQVFSCPLIYEAYRKLMEDGQVQVTDDAMVVEKMTEHPVSLVEGSYENIKITTPEDLEIASLFVKHAVL